MRLGQARRKKSTTTGTELTSHIQHGLREGAMLVLGAMALFLLASFVTYHADDPGWSHTGMREDIHNAAGVVGAWFSDVFFSLFGYLSYLLPVIIAYSGWLVLRGGGEKHEVDYHVLAIRWAGFFVTLAAGCALASIHFSIPESTLPLDGGGILGRWLGDVMAGALGLLGSTLILLAVLLAGTPLFRGISWFRVIYFIGATGLAIVTFIRQKANAIIERIQERNAGEVAKQERQEVVAADKKKTAVREAKGEAKVHIEPTLKKVEISERMDREKQIALFDGPVDSELPALRLLDPPKEQVQSFSNEALEALSRLVEIKLADFNIEVHVVAVHPGPVITRFEMELAPGIKASKITTLSKDLARSLSVVSVLVVEVIPGKSLVGLEIPNENKELVALSEILMSKEFDKSPSPLTIGLGKDIAGHPMVADLAKMPHLLVAGTTGAGKSVCVNAMLMSLLYKSKPSEVRMILIEPKKMEPNVYDRIPHFLAPGVVDMKENAKSCRWCCVGMEKRYSL